MVFEKKKKKKMLSHPESYKNVEAKLPAPSAACSMHPLKVETYLTIGRQQK